MLTSKSHRNLVNFVGFQVGWLVCVMFPGLPAAGLVLMLLVLHLVLISQHRAAELQFIGLGVLLGGLMDTLWFRVGVLEIAGQSQVLAVPPWLVAIWAIFMTTLCHSLNWIGQYRWLPYLLAPIGGPFAYWSASQLGIVVLPDLTLSLLTMAAGWLVLLPLLLFVRGRLYQELTT